MKKPSNGRRGKKPPRVSGAAGRRTPAPAAARGRPPRPAPAGRPAATEAIPAESQQPPPAASAGSAGAPDKHSSRFPVVGLGASAGGLAALERFLEKVPADSGVAYVVVTHQAPDRTTLLTELLGKRTTLPVTTAVDHTHVKPNHVYVAPPGSCLEIRDEHLRVVRHQGSPHLPIDHFFRTLAQNESDHAIGVVLSGNGSDGTVGITEIKGASGLVIAQEPSTAQYTGMPASAIATHLVDYVLAPEDMPASIVRYVKGRLRPAERRSEQDEGDASGGLQRILILLRNRTGNDFRAYKKSTIRRRIERRMHLHGIADTADYARFLEQNGYEIDALFKELLISVTSFFRDHPAFETLQHELSKLIEMKTDEQPLRVWIAGCATGEEAYSAAILIREVLGRAGKDLKVQIFATDLDQQAIEVARHGRYPEGIAADVSPERLERFFTREDSGYCVNKDIRELIVFAVQNLIKDPPFTKLDLVTCRNLLIYLESDLQRRVLSLFNYSLRPGGLLLLGTSESVSGFDDRFALLDKRWKLFRRRENAVAQLVPDFPADPPAATRGGRAQPAARDVPRHATISPLAERLLLSSFAPPSVILNERGELVYVHGRTGQFFEPVTGEPSHNAFHMAREGLRLELPAAVRQAAGSAKPVVRRGLRVKTNGGYSPVRLTVRKLTDPEALRGAFLVHFELEPDTPRVEEKARSRKAHHRTATLEQELHRTRENLHGTIEELETSNEELKSTNEELQSTNEELQSANEELETSREEMQSLNEELQTVNAELEERNRALSQANDDMQNLLNSTDVATVFLDEKLAINRFTKQAKKVFSLIDSDVGRPLADLAANLHHDGLIEDARDVLQSLVFREREIQTKGNSWRQMRIMPYRTHDNLIDGLVLTFVDIDRVKRAEQAAQEARAYAESIVECVDKSLVVLDASMVVVSANHVFYEEFGSQAKDVIGLTLGQLFDGAPGIHEVLGRVRELFDGAGQPIEHLEFETRLPRLDGVRKLTISAGRMREREGRPAFAVMTIDDLAP